MVLNNTSSQNDIRVLRGSKCFLEFCPRATVSELGRLVLRFASAFATNDEIPLRNCSATQASSCSA